MGVVEVLIVDDVLADLTAANIVRIGSSVLVGIVLALFKISATKS